MVGLKYLKPLLKQNQHCYQIIKQTSGEKIETLLTISCFTAEQLIKSMLRIPVPSDGLSELDYTKLSQFDIPEPGNGFRSEINNSVIMAFDDEQEAIEYAHLIDEYTELLSDQESEEFLIAADIIKAIGDDEFVQAYIQS